MTVIDFNKIKNQNLNVKYAEPEIDIAWTAPGEYNGANEKYRHPEGDMIKDGFAPTAMEITDFATIKEDDVYHLYSTIQAPGTSCLWEGQHNYIIHATTENFVDWTMYRPVIYCNPEHPWEESHTWPPYVFKIENKDKYGIVYCGMDHENCQCLCYATSTDLYNWKKDDNNPILRGEDLSWVKKWSDGKRTRHLRDPHVIYYQGYYLLYYTALCDDMYSAVGLAASDDLKVWIDLGPCFKRDASSPWLTESPLVIAYNNSYYLLPSISPGISCFVSSDPFSFHESKELPVTSKGIARKRITAMEVINRNVKDKPWLVGYYLTGNKRIFLGIMEVRPDCIYITHVTDHKQIEGFY